MNEGALAQEYWDLKNQETAITERLQEIRGMLIRNTEKRRAGAFMVKVDSSTREILDQEAAKLLLEQAGLGVPVKPSVQVRLTVKPWVQLVEAA